MSIHNASMLQWYKNTNTSYIYIYIKSIKIQIHLIYMKSKMSVSVSVCVRFCSLLHGQFWAHLHKIWPVASLYPIRMVMGVSVFRSNPQTHVPRTVHMLLQMNGELHAKIRNYRHVVTANNFCNPTLNHFCTIPACDRQTDTWPQHLPLA